MSTTSYLPSREQLLGIIQLQTDIAQLGLDLSGTMDLVVDRALALMVADGVVIALVEDEYIVYRAASGCTAGQLGVRVALNASLSGLCVRTGRTLFCADSETDPDVDRDACRRQGIRSMLVMPLKFGELIVGVIKLVRRQPTPFDEVDQAVLALLAEVLGASVFFAAKYGEDDLFHRATHDEMTGLANRSLFLDRLRGALSISMRDGLCVGVLMVDMDGLKAINDRYGHRAGDVAIMAFAEHLCAAARATDTVARLGGDEFAVLMLPVDDNDSIAEGVARLTIAMSKPFSFQYLDLQLTLVASAGSAMAPRDGIGTEELLDRADQAMYAMKRQRKSS